MSLSGKTYQRLAAEVRAEGDAAPFSQRRAGCRKALESHIGYHLERAASGDRRSAIFAASAAAATDDTGATQVTPFASGKRSAGVNEALTLRVECVDQPELQVDLAVGFDTRRSGSHHLSPAHRVGRPPPPPPLERLAVAPPRHRSKRCLSLVPPPPPPPPPEPRDLGRLTPPRR